MPKGKEKTAANY